MQRKFRSSVRILIFGSAAAVAALVASPANARRYDHRHHIRALYAESVPPGAITTLRHVVYPAYGDESPDRLMPPASGAAPDIGFGFLTYPYACYPDGCPYKGGIGTY